jgi:hypothetical protein
VKPKSARELAIPVLSGSEEGEDEVTVADMVVTHPPSPPSNESFVPVARALLADLQRGIRESVPAVTLEVNVRRLGKRTFWLEIVTLDPTGVIRSLKASPTLRAAASLMISEDEARGNGTWSRLVATLTPEASGDCVRFEVW